MLPFPFFKFPFKNNGIPRTCSVIEEMLSEHHPDSRLNDQSFLCWECVCVWGGGGEDDEAREKGREIKTE